MTTKGSRQPKQQPKSAKALKKRAKTQVSTLGTDCLSWELSMLIHPQRTLQKSKKSSPTTKKPTTATTGPTGSAARFFGTNELFEQVLLHNNTLKGLMPLRRVCKRWQAVIEGTPFLQRQIFLAPQSPTHEWHGDDRKHPFWSNDFYLQHPARQSVLVKKPKGTAPESGKEVYTCAEINPLLFHKTPSHATIPIWQPRKYDPRWRGQNDWNSQELYLRMEAKPSGIRTKSPLLQMFATQPPLKVTGLRVHDPNQGTSTRDVRNPEGVKVIDILRAVEQLEGRKAVVVDEVIFPSDGQEMIEIEAHRDDFPYGTITF
jgi:hypothetical protein